MSDAPWFPAPITLSPAPAPRVSRASPYARPLAGRFTRLVAQGVDSVLALVVAFVAPLLYADPSGSTTATANVRLALCLGGSLTLFAVQMTLLSLRGQTLGKMILNIRIVDHDDESNPGFVRAVCWRVLVPAFLGAVPLLGLLFVLLDVLCILGEERRCLHDLMAGTKVVEDS